MEEQPNVVFDPLRPMGINFPDGKRVEVRFPNDEEWKARKRSIQIKRDGELATQEAPDEDRQFVAAIRSDDGPELDADESQELIDIISQADIDDVIREGQNCRVVLAVPGGATGHLLSVPSIGAMRRFKREWATSRRGRHGKSELQVNLVAAERLYDALCQGTEGYPGVNGSKPFTAVPVIHKAAVALALLDEFRPQVSAGNF